MEEISLREMQLRVDRWIKTIGHGYFSELTNMVLLTEETGELARIIARVFGDQRAKEGDLKKSLSEEMADVMWVLVCLANQTGVDLTEAFHLSMEKRLTGTKKDSDKIKRIEVL